MILYSRGIFLFTFIFLASNAFSFDLRIRIARSKKSFNISGKLLSYKSSLGESASQNLNSVKVICPKGKKKPGVYFEVSSAEKKVKWKDSIYPGKFLISVDPKGRCELINELNIEDYITMVISKEMHPSWPIESLKAQAVAARTYALNSVMSDTITGKLGYKPPYHMINSQLFQVNSSWSEVRLKALAAIDQTRGEILVDQKGKIIPMFYHSKCGGKTITPDKVWGTKIKGYQSVSCPYCYGHGKRDWSFSVSKKKMRSVIKKLKKRSRRSLASKNLEVFSSKMHDHYAKFQIEGEDKVNLNKEKWRRAFGGEQAFSNYFEIAQNGDSYKVKGKGHGHRVGLCQFGAYEMSRRKRKYKDILSYYYPKFKMAFIK